MKKVLFFIYLLFAGGFAFGQSIEWPKNDMIFQRSRFENALVKFVFNNSSTITSCQVRFKKYSLNGILGSNIDPRASPSDIDGNGYLNGITFITGLNTSCQVSFDLHISSGMYRMEALINGTTVSRIFGVGEVFAIAGQSNAAGLYGTDYEKSELPTINSTFVKFNNEKSAFDGNDPGGVNLPNEKLFRYYWGDLGSQLAGKLNVPIAFYQTAWSGTRIVDWKKSANDEQTTFILNGVVTNRFPFGYPYRNLKDFLAIRGKMTGIRAVLWHQGEGDNPNAVFYESVNYNDFLDNVITKSRENGYADLAWVVGRVSLNNGAVDSRSINIINSQNRVIGYQSGNSLTSPGKDFGNPASSVYGKLYVFSGPGTDSIGVANRVDNTHFNRNGKQLASNSWFRSLTNKYNNSDDFFGNSTPILNSQVVEVQPPSCNNCNPTIASCTGTLPSSWSSLSTNGETNPAGCAGYNGGVFTVKGGGGSTHSFLHYAYKSVTGDATIIAKIESVDQVDATTADTRAAITFRNSSDNASAYVTIERDRNNNLAVRTNSTFQGWVGNVVGPVWVRLIKQGSLYTAQYSLNGASWVRIVNDFNFGDIATTCHAGLSTASRDACKLASATFSNVNIISGNSDFLSLSQTTWNTGSGTGTFSILVNSNVSWTSSVITNSPWLSITNPTGSSSGSITLSVLANGGSSRSGTIRVSKNGGGVYSDITVTQSGSVECNPTLNIKVVPSHLVAQSPPYNNKNNFNNNVNFTDLSTSPTLNSTTFPDGLNVFVGTNEATSCYTKIKFTLKRNGVDIGGWGPEDILGSDYGPFGIFGRTGNTSALSGSYEATAIVYNSLNQQIGSKIVTFTVGTIIPPSTNEKCPYQNANGWNHWNYNSNQWVVGQCFAWDGANNRCVFVHQSPSGLKASFNPNSYTNSWDIPSKNDLISFGVPTNNPNIVGCFYPNGNMRVSASSATLQPDDVTLSPNPNNGIFKVNINANVEKEVELLISNKSGKILTTRKVKLSEGSNSFDFKISEMEGLYILNVVDGNVRFKKQIAKIEE